MPRVFVAATLAVGDEIALDDSKRHHLATVLRLSKGAAITLFNGDGHEYAARVLSADRKHMRLGVENRTTPARESPVDITLVQAIARGDRMDFALAKAVELGVNRIRPVFTVRAKIKLARDRLAKKQDHWQGVAESAAEQSGRLICPGVAPACELTTLLAEPPQGIETQRLLLAPGAARSLTGVERTTRVALLIGPESGLSVQEIDTAADAGWQAVTLGPRVLRTETAGMAALAAIQTLWGDLAR